jgi:hypothetical protein
MDDVVDGKGIASADAAKVAWTALAASRLTSSLQGPCPQYAENTQPPPGDLNYPSPY